MNLPNEQVHELEPKYVFHNAIISDEITGDSSNLSDLLNEFNNAPEPVDVPQTEPIFTGEAPNPENKPPISPGNGPNLNPGPSSGGFGTLANEGQKLTAKLFMQGWDALFAGAATMFTKKSEKFHLYKAGEQAVNELSISLAEVMAYYKWEPSPILPFAIGFTGVYGAKGFEVYQDMNNNDSAETIEQKIERLKKENELNELARKVHTKTENHKPNKGGSKPGVKRGPYKKKNQL